MSSGNNACMSRSDIKINETNSTIHCLFNTRVGNVSVTVRTLLQWSYMVSVSEVTGVHCSCMVSVPEVTGLQ